MSLLDLDAIHVYQFAEWTDGISVLVPGGGENMRHKESLDKVRVGLRCTPVESAANGQILADVALKVRLLDITGDGVDIPDKILIGPGQSRS